MKIRSKLILSFLFLIVLTVVLYGLASYSSMSRPLFDMEKNRGFHYSELISYKFNEVLKHAGKDVSLMTRDNFLSYIRNPAKTILPQKEQIGILQNKFIQNVLLQEDTSQHRLTHFLKEGSLIPSGKDLEIRILSLSDPIRPLLRISKKFYTSKGLPEGEGFIFLDLKKIFDGLIFKDSQIMMYVCIRDLSGRLLYCRYNKPFGKEKERQILAHIERIAQSPEGKKSGPFFDVAEILTEDERPSIFCPSEFPTFSFIIPILGLPMLIEADSQSFQSMVSSMVQNMVIIGFSIVWLAFWTAMILGYRVMKPIEELGRGAERITSGEYSHRLKPKGKDEIALLAGKFNEMAEAVEKRSVELERTNEELKAQDTAKNRFLDRHRGP